MSAPADSPATAVRPGSGVATIAAWARLPFVLVRFLFGGAGLRATETVTPTPEWVRHFAFMRMAVYRDVLRGWGYRERFARIARSARRFVPASIAYRLLIRGRAAAELFAMARRNVERYGERTQVETGVSLAYQLADLLAVCFEHPGTFPTEYYAFRLYDPRDRHLAAEVTNAFQVEFVASVVRPPADPRAGAGFTSAAIDALNNKDSFRTLCETAAVPGTPFVAIFQNGDVTWADGASMPGHDLFLKPLCGGEGRGAARVFHDARDGTYRIDRPASLLTSEPYPSAAMTAAALTEWLRGVGRQLPMLLQPRLRAHKALIALVGDLTLPTIRILTVRDRHGACSLLSAYLRFAVADVSVDNGAAGGAAAMIDPVTHRVDRASTLFDGIVDVHPLTGRTIRGATVPHVDRACAHVIQLHRVLGEIQPVPVPVIGWDVAILDDGPIVTEGNTLAAISTPQKLAARGCWTEATFREAVLSYLTPLAGQRISLDPGV